MPPVKELAANPQWIILILLAVVGFVLGVVGAVEALPWMVGLAAALLGASAFFATLLVKLQTDLEVKKLFERHTQRTSAEHERMAAEFWVRVEELKRKIQKSLV